MKQPNLCVSNYTAAAQSSVSYRGPSGPARFIIRVQNHVNAVPALCRVASI